MLHCARRSLLGGCGLAFLISTAFADESGIGLRVDAALKRALAAAAVAPLRTIDYGAFTWIELSERELAKLPAAERAKLDLNLDAFALSLGDRSFDPVRDGVPGTRVAAASSDRDLRLVQFAGPTKSGWIASLESKGAKVVQYIPPFAYVVWARPEELDLPALAADVRWKGEFSPEFRLLDRFRPSPTAASQGASEYRVLVPNVADPARISAELAARGVVLRSSRRLSDTWTLIGIDAFAEQLDAIAETRGVYSVQTAPTDGGLRSEVGAQVNVNNVDETNRAVPGYLAYLASLGINGTGVVVAGVDSGIKDTHPDLVGRLDPCMGPSCGTPATQSNHGTHTAGIIAGDGSSGVVDGFGFLRGLGVAPGARLIEQRYSPTFTEMGGMLTLMHTSIHNGADLSNNSWGPAGTPRGYDSDTLQVDIGVRDADDLVVGNQQLHYILAFMNGFGGISSQGTPDEAKNCFTVGSTRLQNSAGGGQFVEIDDLSSNTAHGPALDGRIIPHIVAPGCWVDSTLNTSSYGFDCGTSMAAPQVSGGVALFIERWRNLPDYISDPSPALVKAAFTVAARSLVGHFDADGGLLGHPFDSRQGWGRMNLEAVIDPALGVLYWDNPQIFDATGQEWSRLIRAADENQPIRIMLAWTDAPGHGLGGSTPAWNNDLDLVLEDGPSVYRGNAFGLDGWSVAGGAADAMNNLEGIFIGPAAGSTYNLRILAANINSDAIPGDAAAVDQDFAVVCSNCVLAPPPPILFGDMNCDGFVTVGDIAGFVLALTDPAEFAIQNPTCDILHADVNQDEFVTVGDIAGFVTLLTGG